MVSTWKAAQLRTMKHNVITRLKSDTEAVRLMLDHLAQNKFDISTLEEWLKSFPSP